MRCFKLAATTVVYLGFLTGVTIAQSALPVEGYAVRLLGNKKDIYHAKNELDRQLLMKAAIIDAVEKGTNIRVQGLISYEIVEVSQGDYELSMDKFISATLQQYHVTWQRTSAYVFQRDPKHKKKWTCYVKGNIINQKIQAGTGQHLNIAGEDPLSFSQVFITRKSFRTVHLSAGSDAGLQVGDRLVAKKIVTKPTVLGADHVDKDKAHIYLTRVKNDYAIGKVVRGFYRSLEKKEVAHSHFPIFRKGFSYQLYLQEQHLDLTRWGNSTLPLEFIVHSFSYSQWNLIQRWGWELSLDVFHMSSEDKQDVGFIPKAGLYYNIPILPEILYLQPRMYLGYGFFENNANFFTQEQTHLNAVYEAKVGGYVRVSRLDFFGGMSYRYVFNNPMLSNFYPYMGLAVNFNSGR